MDAAKVLSKWFYNDKSPYSAAIDLMQKYAERVVEQNLVPDRYQGSRQIEFKQEMSWILRHFTIDCVKIHQRDAASNDHVFAWFRKLAMQYFNMSGGLPTPVGLWDVYQHFKQNKQILVDEIFRNGLQHVLANAKA